MSDYSVATHAQGKSAADGRMDRYHEYVGRRRIERRVWPGAAFIVEALLLLVFLTGSLAVLMSLNADADRAGRESADLMDAIVLASNVAEEFSADPVAFQEAWTADPTADRWLSRPLDEAEDGGDVLIAECTVSVGDVESGTMHRLAVEVHKICVPADPGQAAAEGVLFEEDGACFQMREEEPLYTLETACYVPAHSGRVDAAAPFGGSDDADAPVALGTSRSAGEEVSHG